VSKLKIIEAKRLKGEISSSFEETANFGFEKGFTTRALSKVGFLMIYEWHMSQVIFKSDTYLHSTISHFPCSTVKHELQFKTVHVRYKTIFSHPTYVLRKTSHTPSTAQLKVGSSCRVAYFRFLGSYPVLFAFLSKTLES